MVKSINFYPRDYQNMDEIRSLASYRLLCFLRASYWREQLLIQWPKAAFLHLGYFSFRNQQVRAPLVLLLTHPDLLFTSFSNDSVAGMTILPYSTLKIAYHCLLFLILSRCLASNWTETNVKLSFLKSCQSWHNRTGQICESTFSPQNSLASLSSWCQHLISAPDS